MNIKRYINISFILLIILILSCGFSDKFSGKWINKRNKIEKATITKSGSSYTMDLETSDTGQVVSFVCLKESDVLKCKMGFGDTILHIDKNGLLIMTNPLGMQFEFKKI